MTVSTIRVVIADDQPLVRDGIAYRLGSEEEINVVGVANDAEEAVRLALSQQPHVVLMDLDMPGRSVFEASIEIAAMLHDIRVLFLTAYASDSAIAQAIQVDASGMVTKDDAPEQLVSAIRGVVEGKIYFSPEIEERLEFGDGGPRVLLKRDHAIAHLTKREREVLMYVASGMTKKDMASTMHLSVKTIENHTSALMTKLSIHNRVELTRFAIRNGVVRP